VIVCVSLVMTLGVMVCRSTSWRAGGSISSTSNGPAAWTGGQPVTVCGPVITAVGTEVAVAAPSEFVAVTWTRIVRPWSAASSGYDDVVEPATVAQMAPTAPQRCQAYVKESGAVPVQVPVVAVSAALTSGPPETPWLLDGETSRKTGSSKRDRRPQTSPGPCESRHHPRGVRFGADEGVTVVLVLLLLLIRWAVLAAAFAVTTWILSGIEISGGFWGYLWVSLLFGIVNAIIGTILRILTLPLTLLTLGLFSIIVNAFLLQITDWISDHLTIDEFWWTAIWAAIILAIATVILELIVRALIAPAADS
jgi:putative membrane protein